MEDATSDPDSLERLESREIIFWLKLQPWNSWQSYVHLYFYCAGGDQTTGPCHGQGVTGETSNACGRWQGVFETPYFIKDRDKGSSGYMPPISQKPNWEPGSCWAGCCPEDITPAMGFFREQRADCICSVSRKPMDNVSIRHGCVAIPPHVLAALFHSLRWDCPFSSCPRAFWGLILWSNIRLP